MACNHAQCMVAAYRTVVTSPYKHHSDQRWHWQFSSAAVFFLLLALLRLEYVQQCITVGTATPIPTRKWISLSGIFAAKLFTCANIQPLSQSLAIRPLFLSLCQFYYSISRFCVDSGCLQRSGQAAHGSTILRSSPTTCIRNGYDIYLNLVYYLFTVVNTTRYTD